MTGVSLASFVAGMGVGLTVAVPIGPMGLLCIQRTLAFGLEAGFATGLGAATVHLALGTMTAFGFGAVLLAWTGSQIFSFVSAGLLFWFAARIMRCSVPVGPAPSQREGWLRFYGSAILFGVSNPLAILLFAAALPVFAEGSDAEAAPLLVAGVFLGSIAWWICLATTISLIRNRLSSRIIGITTRASGLMLAGLGAFTMANAFGLELP
ncbi:threonine/homoserine/homoserine lactone efflux protein [Microvirga lupini]|uniref:Threonine/homoserine/homoserine lactone efflux protein n=1 Tax=Microvirga lupini TaxID=420324 RepID=A0A7W4YV48_9HYPH|nr:LysE family transporter [Microvirga lupini]MBB3018052.1 threonine/homoserine/homoserine lactone efflux protein [Microvirga lupini]